MRRILMPVAFILTILVIILAALNMRTSPAPAVKEEVPAQPVQEETPQVAETQEPEPVPLEKNAHRDVTELFDTYYKAAAAGDTDEIERISCELTPEEKLRIHEIARYIESYPSIDVYTKPGPVPDSYVAYVCTKLKFVGKDWLIPGLETMYVCTREDGSLYINNEENQPAAVSDYIYRVSIEDDVVDLTNETTAAYNSLLADNGELSLYLEELSSSLDLRVGQELARLEGRSQIVTGNEKKTYLVADDTVNVRKAPSQDAERLGEVKNGQQLELLETLDNGWSKVILNGQEAYVKSEYFHVQEPEPEEDTGEDTPEDGTQSEGEEAEGSDTSDGE